MKMGAKLQFRTKDLSRNWSFECNCVPNPEIGNENFGSLFVQQMYSSCSLPDTFL
mgnify:CR=1 FL=1